jgi:hypothetical protein
VWGYFLIPSEAALTIAQLADAHRWELSTTVGSITYWRQRPNQQLGQIAPNIAVGVAPIPLVQAKQSRATAIANSRVRRLGKGKRIGHTGRSFIDVSPLGLADLDTHLFPSCRHLTDSPQGDGVILCSSGQRNAIGQKGPRYWAQIGFQSSTLWLSNWTGLLASARTR